MPGPSVVLEVLISELNALIVVKVPEGIVHYFLIIQPLCDWMTWKALNCDSLYVFEISTSFFHSSPGDHF